MSLLNESKPVQVNFRPRVQTKPKHGHREQDLDITGTDGNAFRLILRQSTFNHLDFSVILGVFPKESNELFRLRRYNGRSHEHSNKLEGQKFYNFHIHTATERYQELGKDEDAYAEETERYSDLQSAIDCMLSDCGFKLPADMQGSLFQEL